MIKIFVDSGSSIKADEAKLLGVEILPLKILLGDREYLDGVDLSMNTFYEALIEKKQFPKTSLPSLFDAEKRVAECTCAGDEVLLLTISSGISGTYGALRSVFADNPKVAVIDTHTAVGGMRILVLEALKHRYEPLSDVVEGLKSLISKIRVVAIPETLEYLHRGGRLSKTAFAVGSVLHLKPIISLDSSDGRVKVLGKALGLRRAMEFLTNYLITEKCDTDYPIVPSYTYKSDNLDKLLSLTDERFRPAMIGYDDLDPAISCHWGPGAFGYIFVSKK